MGVTRTEIKVTDTEAKVDKGIKFLESNGYVAKDYHGYETWVKACVPIWSNLNGSYYCMQVHFVGDTWVIEEWVIFYGVKLAVDSIFGILWSLGTAIPYHNKLMNFFKNL